MSWQFNRTEAVFIQIARRLKNDILCGKYLPDGQFPSVRQIAADAAVNPNTVQKALLLLEEERLLCTKGTVGRFVTTDTGAIESARKELRREMMQKLLEGATALGISKEELIEYIEKEGK